MMTFEKIPLDEIDNELKIDVGESIKQKAFGFSYWGGHYEIFSNPKKGYEIGFGSKTQNKLVFLNASSEDSNKYLKSIGSKYLINSKIDIKNFTVTNKLIELNEDSYLIRISIDDECHIKSIYVCNLCLRKENVIGSKKIMELEEYVHSEEELLILSKLQGTWFFDCEKSISIFDKPSRSKKRFCRDFGKHNHKIIIDPYNNIYIREKSLENGEKYFEKQNFKLKSFKRNKSYKLCLYSDRHYSHKDIKIDGNEMIELYYEFDAVWIKENNIEQMSLRDVFPRRSAPRNDNP